MRIILEKGKQNELIVLAKQNQTWENLARELGCNAHYLANDLRFEKRSLLEVFYKKLCSLAKIKFDEFIIGKKEDNWGQSKGGLNSPGSLKILPEIKFDERLAEFVGAVLGDGHVEFYKKGKKVGVYGIRIAGDFLKDASYHIDYLKNLCKIVFNLDAVEIIPKDKHERFLDVRSKELVNFFSSMGIKPGDKIKNQSTIPKWIFNDENCLKACVRGLIDTDGSIARMSKRDYRLLRIFFTNHNFTLLSDTRKAFIKLGFNPSKLMNNRQFYLSRQTEIERYIKEIGFSNEKHQNRFKKFKAL